jgi:hypothetical protein
MSKPKTAVQAWEQALAAMRKLPLEARINEEPCRKLLERVRAGDFSAEIERVVRDCGEGVRSTVEITRKMLELKSTWEMLELKSTR